MINTKEFSINDNTDQLNVTKENLAATLSDTSKKQCVESIQSCNFTDHVNHQLNKKKIAT